MGPIDIANSNMSTQLTPLPSDKARAPPRRGQVRVPDLDDAADVARGPPGGGRAQDGDPGRARHPPQGGLHHEPHLRHLGQPPAADLHLLEAQRRGE